MRWRKWIFILFIVGTISAWGLTTFVGSVNLFAGRFTCQIGDGGIWISAHEPLAYLWSNRREHRIVIWGLRERGIIFPPIWYNDSRWAGSYVDGKWIESFNWLIIPFWLILAIQICWAIFFRPYFLVRKRRSRGDCIVCGYHLLNPRAGCPECGTGRKSDAGNYMEP